MEKKNQFKLADEEFIRQFKGIDGDLVLVFGEFRPTSAPDEGIDTIHFRMTHHGADAGEVNLRVGYTVNIIRYRGNIGYAVRNNFRGKNFAAKSCQLLLPLLARLRFSPVWITCNPDNLASKKSIENIGATYLETITMPDDDPHKRFYPQHAQTKMRFKWEL